MDRLLNYVSNHPSIWLGLYGTGSVMVIATIAELAGTGAAGSATGFLVLGAAIGYEMIEARNEREKISRRMTSLSGQQNQIVRELERTQSSIKTLTDEIKDVRNAPLHRKLTLVEERAQRAKAYRDSLEKPPRSSAQAPDLATTPAVSATAKVSNDTQPPLRANLANSLAAAIPSSRKRFKDLALMAMTRAPLPPKEASIEKALAEAEAPEPEEKTPNYSDSVVTELLHQAIEKGRFETFAQPIVKLPSRRPVYIELFARVRARAGIYLAAGQYRPLAEKESLIANVDRSLLKHAVETIQSNMRRGTETGYFINLSTHSLHNKPFMGDVLEFVQSHRELAHHLIFELQQKDFDHLEDRVLKILDGLSHLGCRFSLDNIQNPNIDFEKLKSAKVSFLKIEASRLVALSGSPEGENLVRRIKTNLDRHGIELIVEKMETEHDVRELLDFDIDYGEGFLFGKPDLEIAYRPRKLA